MHFIPEIHWMPRSWFLQPGQEIKSLTYTSMAVLVGSGHINWEFSSVLLCWSDSACKHPWMLKFQPFLFFNSSQLGQAWKHSCVPLSKLQQRCVCNRRSWCGCCQDVASGGKVCTVLMRRAGKKGATEKQEKVAGISVLSGQLYFPSLSQKCS